MAECGWSGKCWVGKLPLEIPVFAAIELKKHVELLLEFNSGQTCPCMYGYSDQKIVSRRSDLRRNAVLCKSFEPTLYLFIYLWGGVLVLCKICPVFSRFSLDIGRFFTHFQCLYLTVFRRMSFCLLSSLLRKCVLCLNITQLNKEPVFNRIFICFVTSSQQSTVLFVPPCFIRVYQKDNPVWCIVFLHYFARPERFVWPFSHWSLITNGLNWMTSVKKPLLRKGNREKSWNMPNYTRTGVNSVTTDLNDEWWKLTFLVQIIVSSN